MSAPDTTIRESTESRSSVKFSTTAKGDAQVEIKVYQGDTPLELQSAFDLASSLFDQARTRYGIGVAA